ncbi:MAG TPA: hypothetical protein PK760_15920, partial [Flavobacteriales bacterium]|nr:hypothetical protein [Flavobacteriales bacterium]
KKKDREHLELLASEQRQLSDSLHTVSLEQAQLATESERKRAEAEQVKGFMDRLVKFYYLTPEEEQLIAENEDRSHYFQVKTRAIEQYTAADEAEEAATSNREVGKVLLEQARVAEREAASDQPRAVESAERARLLNARAALLLGRADSLENVASRLRGAAAINENQASVMLQAMPSEEASSIMAFEMRTRRTESLLAETREPAGRNVEVAQPDTSAITNGAATSAQEPAPMDRRAAEPVAERAPVQPVPTGEVLKADVFEFRANVEAREATIPLDAPMPAGIVFKVQIGAFKKPISQQAFSDMTPVAGETVGNGLVRYTAGMFTGFDGAAAAKDLVRERGYRDAFVVAYRDGKRIS